MSRVQRRNGREMLKAVQERAHNQNWGPNRAHRVAVLCAQCCYTESNMLIYANVANEESRRLHHDAVGSDHDSVGMFQQRVPMWGTTRDCMDPKKSCHKFLRVLGEKGLDHAGGGPVNRLRIQGVQVSFDSNGWNYAANYLRAKLFVARNWDKKNMKVKGT